ncbi:IS256 family transposase [Eggerthella lenta]|uniref:IS256 family transposase n=1 Tax=Eggerthella lenta TaxID=84112 RepID=UPI0018A014A9|nr:IS256 family transposase [Eggerthella lenta]
MSESIISVDQEAIKGELRDLVKTTVEETLNALLDEEADELVGAERYERSASREAYRSGHYKRKLATASGEIELNIPKLRGATFQTAVIERYRRREASVEEAMIEMYLAGVSTRRIEDVSEILWDTKVSAGTVSNLNERAFKSVEEWRGRPLVGNYPYVYIDGIYLKRSWGGTYENVAVMVAIGVNQDGYREIIGCAEGFTESKDSWREFLLWLKSRGLKGVRMITGDKSLGMLGAIEEVFPQAEYQRCTVHFYRNVFGKVPKGKRPYVAKMLKAIHAQESFEASMMKSSEVAEKLREMKLAAAAKTVEEGVVETLTYTAFPMQHWTRIRTNNAIERLNREIRRRTRVVGTFPDGHSALMLVAARCKYVAESDWGRRRYLDVSAFEETEANH